MEEILSQLNDSQRDAVKYNEGPSLVIAGAGSGKTRVLTYKIAALLKSGYEANRILALTFTNKAADEMKSRIDTIVGEGVSKRLWMGTFHSVFARILRQQAEKIGYKSSFSIYDTSDSKSLLKSIVKEMELDEKNYAPKKLLSRISQLKNSLITPDAYRRNEKLHAEDVFQKIPRLPDIYSAYFARCYKASAMDFDDILLYTNILFRDFPEVLEIYQDWFDYILVDEYQDTNFAQHLVVKKLAEKHHHVCVVGDDAQSIYSFRGANIENILNFKNIYPECKIFKLERNYRSTPNIVKVANSLITKNKRQLKKNVYSEEEEGEKVKVICSSDETDEAKTIVSIIKAKTKSGVYKNKDMAILYRTNSQSRVFEDILSQNAIPFIVYGGTAFYQRKEIKDIIAYLRLIVNDSDEEAFRRIINYPTRGIGETSLTKIKNTALCCNASYMDVISDPLKYNLPVNAGTANKLTKFHAMITDLSQNIINTDAADFVTKVIAATGIIDDIKADTSVEGINKMENINEFISGIQLFCDKKRDELDQNNSNEETLGDNEGNVIIPITEYLPTVSLKTDNDEDEENSGDNVSLMTIHSSKGLEFKNVFIVGVEEELLPSKMAQYDANGIEEERRLLYVAITRAENNCYLSYAKSRYRNGEKKYPQPSQFIGDIDERLLDLPFDYTNLSDYSSINMDFFPSSFGGGKAYKTNSSYKKDDDDILSKPAPYVAPRKLKPLGKATTPTNAPSEPTQSAGGIEVGSWVEHEKFGRGTVINIEGSGTDAKLTINFHNEGEKKILLKFARLKNLGK